MVIDETLQLETGGGMTAGSRSHPPPKRLVAEQLPEAVREVALVGGRDQKPGDAVLDDGRCAANAGADDRDAGGRRLDQADRRALVV